MSRDEKIARVLTLLDEVDCCTGYGFAKGDLPKFWEAQELARQILGTDQPAQRTEGGNDAGI